MQNLKDRKEITIKLRHKGLSNIYPNFKINESAWEAAWIRFSIDKEVQLGTNGRFLSYSYIYSKWRFFRRRLKRPPQN